MDTLVKQMGKLMGLTGEVSLATNGYLKMENGLIIQWGLSDPVSPEKSSTVTFPIAFPNACFTVIPGTYCQSGANADVWAQVNSFNTSSFTWFAQASGDIVNIRVSWIAIGR